MMHKIPIPITFNPHKHHFHFLLEQIEIWKKQEWEIVQPQLLCLGENLLDFYIGQLTVNEICTECLHYFSNKNINEYQTFLDWLKPIEYRKIKLSDTSVWLIKKGLDPDCFIHIHPAKKSPFSIRVRAITLKTVAALQIQSCLIQNDKKENLKIVNQIRKEFLNISPIKSLYSENGILKLWQFFEKNY